MKHPNHLILDLNQNLTSPINQYWIFLFFSLLKKDKKFSIFPFQYRKFLFFQKKIFNNKLNYQKKFTIKYNLTETPYFLSKTRQNRLKKLLKPKLQLKFRQPYNSFFIYKFYFFFKKKIKFDLALLKRLHKKIPKITKQTNFFNSNKTLNLFNIYFLKKERLYTKLKYSRTPQYDIVSGGLAAIFSGFLGFLICEKFGFELLDSGDFYILFMYIVFFSFFVRLFFKIESKKTSAWSIFSFKWLLQFLKSVTRFFFKFFF